MSCSRSRASRASLNFIVAGCLRELEFAQLTVQWRELEHLLREASGCDFTIPLFPLDQHGTLAEVLRGVSDMHHTPATRALPREHMLTQRVPIPSLLAYIPTRRDLTPQHRALTPSQKARTHWHPADIPTHPVITPLQQRPSQPLVDAAPASIIVTTAVVG